MRKFAADQLGENVGGAYESIAPVDQSAIVYVVMAAPRDSLEPYTWWFPIVGRVPYRGYFDKSDATGRSGVARSGGPRHDGAAGGCVLEPWIFQTIHC